MELETVIYCNSFSAYLASRISFALAWLEGAPNVFLALIFMERQFPLKVCKRLLIVG